MSPRAAPGLISSPADGPISCWDSGVKILGNGDRVVCPRWDTDDDRRIALAVRPDVQYPAPAGLDHLAHEYGFRDGLDGAWAGRPLVPERHLSQPILVLEEPGGGESTETGGD